MTISGINHVTVLISDIDKAVKFYGETLGLEIFPSGKCTWVRVGNQFIHLAQNSGISTPNTFSHFAIEVDSLMEYITGLVSKGVEVFDLNDDLNKINCDLEVPNRQFFVTDPDGNLIEFIDSNNIFFKKGLS
jgi:glyoxylase I family protein